MLNKIIYLCATVSIFAFGLGILGYALLDNLNIPVMYIDKDTKECLKVEVNGKFATCSIIKENSKYYIQYM